MQLPERRESNQRAGETLHCITCVRRLFQNIVICQAIDIK